MQVVILGSGSPIPAPDRAGPSTLVRTSIGDLLFDAGRGVSMRAAGALSSAVAFRAVFLTHLHSDHVTDLNDLITTRWAMSLAPSPLTVFGPVGTVGLVAATEAMLETDIGYRLAHHADLTWRPATVATDVTDGVVFEQGDVRDGRTHRPRPRSPDRGLPHRRRRRLGGHRRGHRALRRARPTV